MADFPSAANGIIVEEGGQYYHVRFNWVPRSGELIDLTSFLEIKEKSPDESHRFYEVVAVVHKMYDVHEDHHGNHSLEVVVKKSNSKHFN